MTVFVHKIAAKKLCTLFIEADNQRMLSKALSAAFENSAGVDAPQMPTFSAVAANRRYGLSGRTFLTFKCVPSQSRAAG